MGTGRNRHTEKVTTGTYAVLGSFVLLLAICLLAACVSDEPSGPTMTPAATAMPEQSLSIPDERPLPPTPSPTSSATVQQPTISAIPQVTRALPTPSVTGTAPALSTQTVTASRVATIPAVGDSSPAEPLAIVFFEILELQDTEEGKRITFNWSAEGVTARLFSGTQKRLQDWWVVPLSGTLTVDARGTVYRDPEFTLVVADSDDWFSESTRKVQASVQVEWGCEIDYFFSPGPRRCPLGPVVSTWAAEQLFEGGRMIWLEVEGAIYVFYNQGANGSIAVERYDDNWEPGDPESDPTIIAPTGFYQPVRGFGQVWRDEQVRERLGWALAPELGFETAIQHEHHEGSSSGAPTYLLTSDGQVIWRFHSSWGFGLP
jgi:hypothetical protein